MADLDQDGLDVEFLVVDNGSDDDTRDVLNAFTTKLTLKFWSEPRPGKNRCLNQAIKQAIGELFVFTDDDVTPSPDWLQQYAAALTRWPEDQVFGGRIDLGFPPDAPDWIMQLRPPYSTYAFSDFDPGTAEGPTTRCPTGPNMAVAASVFQSHEFNPDVGPAGKSYAMGSETELLFRLRDAGHRFIYLPDAQVVHRIRNDQLSLTWLAGRAQRLGRGAARSAGKSTRLGGVVWRIWAKLFLATPLVWITTWLPDGWRFWSVWNRNAALGFLREKRQMIKEGHYRWE